MSARSPVGFLWATEANQVFYGRKNPNKFFMANRNPAALLWEIEALHFNKSTSGLQILARFLQGFFWPIEALNLFWGLIEDLRLLWG